LEVVSTRHSGFAGVPAAVGAAAWGETAVACSAAVGWAGAAVGGEEVAAASSAAVGWTEVAKGGGVNPAQALSANASIKNRRRIEIGFRIGSFFSNTNKIFDNCTS